MNFEESSEIAGTWNAKNEQYLSYNQNKLASDLIYFEDKMKILKLSKDMGGKLEDEDLKLIEQNITRIKKQIEQNKIDLELLDGGIAG